MPYALSAAPTGARHYKYRYKCAVFLPKYRVPESAGTPIMGRFAKNVLALPRAAAENRYGAALPCMINNSGKYATII